MHQQVCVQREPAGGHGVNVALFRPPPEAIELAAEVLRVCLELELLVGDGWHFAYGKQAIGRVRLLEGPDWSEGRTIASFDGEYTVREIFPIGDRLVAVGTRAVHLLERDALGWSDHVLAPIEETGHAVVIQEAGGPAVLISGDPARVVPIP